MPRIRFTGALWEARQHETVWDGILRSFIVSGRLRRKERAYKPGQKDGVH